jgi:DNA invertase Pin-like site-specific DNA recombinase
MLAGMLSVFAQFGRQLIIERVRSGMNHAKKRGTRGGKAIGRLATVAQRATDIRALAHEGLSMAAIAPQARTRVRQRASRGGLREGGWIGHPN